MKTNNNIENWYKSIVESNDEFPPEMVWEEVQNELDIKMAWTGISSVLAQQKRRNALFALSVAASFILLLGFGGYLIYFSNKQLNNIDKNIVHEHIDNVSIEIDAYSEPEQIIAETPLFSLINENFQETENVSIIKMQTITYDVFIEQLDTFSELNISPILIADNNISLDYQKSIDIGLQFENWTLDTRIGDATGKRAFSDLNIGITGQFANTWMLNNKTYTGLKSDELITTNISFGKNLGVSLGTNINKNLFLKSEIFWLSEQKQSYNEYINGRYVNNTLALNYYSVLLKMNYKLKQNRLEHYFALGGYIDVMHNATQDINGNLKDIKEEYSNIDYGVFLGYEYPIKINSSFYFVPGIGAKVGLNNVFSGNELVPDYLNKTRNTSVNLSFSLIYSVF
jgi:hypothetical protein